MGVPGVKRVGTGRGLGGLTRLSKLKAWSKGGLTDPDGQIFSGKIDNALANGP